MPAQLIISPLTGTSVEEVYVETPIPNMKETLKTNILIEFSMGKASIIELSRFLSTAPNQMGDTLRMAVKWETTDDYRELYSGDIRPVWVEDGKNRQSAGSMQYTKDRTYILEFTFEELTGDSIGFWAKDPIYWINEYFEIPLVLDLQ